MRPRSRATLALLSMTVVAALATPTGAAPGAMQTANTSSSQSATAADAKAGPYTSGRYLVTFTDEPVASYDGYVRGYPATRPAPGRKINPNATAVQRWRDRLTAIHNRALARVGAEKIYDYTVTNNGVAAHLSARQATALAKDRRSWR